jgi:hypothetical protein
MTMTIRTGGALRVAFLAASAAFTVGCSGDLTYPSAVRVSPTAGNFALDSYVTFVVRNDSRQTINVDRCGTHVSMGMDRRVGGEWQNEMSSACILSYYTGPLALAPGESVTDSVLVRSAGTFRVYVNYLRGEQDGRYQARSGGFTVD